MMRQRLKLSLAGLLAMALPFTGCKKQEAGNGAPPPANVVHVQDMNLITVDEKKAALFKTVAAESRTTASQLNATGAVAADVSRTVPVISLANGRVVDVKARLDDNVKEGSTVDARAEPGYDNRFNAYLKAVNDEQLANKAIMRAKELLKHGAISAGHGRAGRRCRKERQGGSERGGRTIEDPGRGQGASQQPGQCLCAHIGRHYLVKT